MRRFNVVVEVEVVVDLYDGWGWRMAEKSAIKASSHNKCSPHESSNLFLPGVGHAEVVKQDIKSRVEVVIPDAADNR